MDKLKMQTPNKVNDNVDRIAAIFPNCITESIGADGKPIKVVDFDLLKQELSSVAVEGTEERYQFTWADKKKSILLANSPISKTLRPCREESVNFDTTKNLYIEGDNLDVLKLLQETYMGLVKTIYIDPPYNTGSNILYLNDYSKDEIEYLNESGQTDEDNFRIVQNLESNGRFHTDWLNIMYPLLKLAKDLLADNGIIFIAIDDNELYNIKKICDETFGASNYVGTIVTRCNPQGRGKNNIDPCHEYHIVFARNILSMQNLKINNIGKKGGYGSLKRTGTNSRKTERPLRFFPLLVKDGKISIIPEEEYKKIYSPSEKLFDEIYLSKLREKYEKLGYNFVLPIAENGEEKVWQREYKRVKNECKDYIFESGQIKVPLSDKKTPMSLWVEDRYSNVEYGTNYLKKLFGVDSAPFDYPKSIQTLIDILSMNDDENAIILDFFSGSGTTADAVMQLNIDGANRRFIAVQVPENLDARLEKASGDEKKSIINTIKFLDDLNKPHFLSEIGKERIRRAGQKISKENRITAPDLDIGFRVLKIDSSNMKPVFYNPDSINQDLLSDLTDNIKEDRTPEDLLFQVMLDMGIDLSNPITVETLSNKKVFTVGTPQADGTNASLICCFDKDVTKETVTEIAKRKPLYAVFRDSGFERDDIMVSFDQIFETFSPTTERRVI